MAFFVTLLLFAASFILSEITKPKPRLENARPSDLGDFNFPTATEGRVVPLVWGTVRLSGPNVVWYGDLRQRAIKKKVKTGLFSSAKVTTGFKYFIGIQFGLCRGEANSLQRIWIGDKEVFNGSLTSGSTTINQPKLFGGDNLGNGGVEGQFTFFPGTEAQNVSTYLSTFQQQGGDTPAYRGTCYGVFEQGYIGNSTSIQPWAFEVRRLPVGPGSSGAKAVNSGNDANPAYVLYEILTNAEWGLGFVDGDIDTATFDSVATTLQTEGNGFSMVLDQVRDVADMIEEIQRQIDGVVYLDQSTGKWTIKLVRADFTVGTIPALTDANVLKVEDYARGAWEDTTNYVTVQFTDRSRDYFQTYSLAQDMANFRIQAKPVKANIQFPGVKDKTLANNLVWRELRALSYPLAKVTITVDRTFWDITPGQAVKWTNASLGLTELVMRVTRVDLGELSNGKIVLTLVQDVYATQSGVFGAPIATGWTAPSNTLGAIPAAEQVAFEAPKALSRRDTDALSANLPFRVYAAARNQGDGTVEMDMRTRTGTDVYETERTIDDFTLIGELTSAIGPGLTSTTITITPTPDSQSLIQTELENIDDEVLGNDLTQLALVGSEFMLIKNAVNNATNIDLQTVYRGVLDSAPDSHTAGTKVYILSAGGGIGSRSWANGNVVDVKLVSIAPDTELAEATATVAQVTMNNRHLRPYPPTGITVNGSGAYAAGPHSLDANGSLDNNSLLIGFRRRDLDEFQENARHINGDAAPGNSTTKYRAQVYNTSSGDVLLYTTDFNAGGNSLTVRRTDILRHTSGAIPTSVRIEVQTRHTISSTDYDALQDAKFGFTVDSAELSNDTNMGVLANLAISNTYTAPDTGNYTVNIGQANTGGPIEYRINGGSWNTVINTSGTTGTINGVTATDTIELRANGLTLGTPPDQTFCEVLAPTSTANGYCIFYT